ncbi:MAG: glycosyltransferase family 4 protein [Thermofilum sp.]
MRVLLTPHVEHYTIGLSQELSKYAKLILLSEKRFNTTARQVVIPNLPLPNFKGLVKWFFFKPLSHLFDVIHVNTSQEGLLARNIDKLIVTEHGWPDPKLVERSELQYYLKERTALIQLYEEGARIITISNYSAEMLRKLYGVKVHRVIYHGLLDIFLTRKPRNAPKEHRILWVSRLVRMKEPGVFLDAVAKIRVEPTFKVFLRGDGPLRHYLENFVRKSGLEKKVFFINRIGFHKMPSLYSLSTIYVHTCSQEPFGLSVLEAMGGGLPVIVPSSGGAYEVAGEAALTFKPRDSEDLAEKILSLLHDAEMYEKFSRKSLERAKGFSWKKTAREYLEIYNELA